MARRVIALLTDFGYRDYFVAVMKGVILRINPEANIVDVSHDVPPHDIRFAAFLLWRAYRWFPEGTIFVAVVDPGVGTERKPIVVRTRHYIFVGPDNGVLSLAAEEDGVEEVYEVTYRMPDTSFTFHGRDIFAPAAALISLGVPLSAVGRRVETYARLPKPSAQVLDDSVVGEAIYVDRFGNVYTSILSEQLLSIASYGDCVEVSVSDRVRIVARVVPSYGFVEVGHPLVTVNSEGFVELAVREGSFADRYRVYIGEKIVIRGARCS